MPTVTTEGEGSQGEEEEDIRALFSFNRLGKGGRYARNPGNASVKSLGDAPRWLVITFKPAVGLKRRNL